MINFSVIAIALIAFQIPSVPVALIEGALHIVPPRLSEEEAAEMRRFSKHGSLIITFSYFLIRSSGHDSYNDRMTFSRSWTKTKLPFLIFILAELTPSACSYLTPSGSNRLLGTGYTVRNDLPDDLLTALSLFEYLLSREREYSNQDFKTVDNLRAHDMDDLILSSESTGRNFYREVILTALLNRLDQEFLPKIAKAVAMEYEGNPKIVWPIVSGEISHKAAASSDVDTKIDSVISLALKSKSKRGRSVNRAMPPTNELCRMMNIQCY
ncbi:hypothetical protein PoB_006289800 [Plakobranchus ocellatus]|uniref:Uncharacterized protein n=1 Tax=Plakobranchus ocellatus TaxID=259542 RepID=A0AAV4CWX4_9GAST|nr:hypothetical protein PoB_006289800 [Plakobranchus ocellatus]